MAKLSTTALMSKKGRSAPPATGDLQRIPLRQLRECPGNARKFFAETELRELADSIRSKGLLEPLVVRPYQKAGKKYEVVCGARRFRACAMAGLQHVPCLVRKIPDNEVLELMLVENLHREDLNVMEQAHAVKILRRNRTPDEVAQLIGKSRSWVFARARLDELPAPIQKSAREGKIRASHLELLSQVQDEGLQAQLADEVQDGTCGLTELKDFVRGSEYQQRVQQFVAFLKAKGLRVKLVSSLEGSLVIGGGHTIPKQAKKDVQVRIDYSQRTLSKETIQKCLDGKCNLKGKCIGVLVERVDVTRNSWGLDRIKENQKPKCAVGYLQAAHVKKILGIKSPTGNSGQIAHNKKKAEERRTRAHALRQAIFERFKTASLEDLTSRDKGLLFDDGVLEILNHTAVESECQIKFRGDAAKQLRSDPGRLIQLVGLSALLNDLRYCFSDNEIKRGVRFCRAVGIDVPNNGEADAKAKKSGKTAKRKK